MDDATNSLLVFPLFFFNMSGFGGVSLYVEDGKLELQELLVDTTTAVRDSNTDAESELDTWYDVRTLLSGNHAEVWRGEQGAALEKVLTTDDIVADEADLFVFVIDEDAEFSIDNVDLKQLDLANAEITEYEYNDANELTAQTVGGVTTNFSYDDWGRVLSKWQGDGSTVHAEYLWRYGSYLKRVDTTFPDEETVAYLVDGLGHRRLKALDPDTYDQDNFTWYRWAGMAVLSEYEDYGTSSSGGIGTRERGYVGGLAQIEGSNPSTGTYQYMTHDHLGSVRGIYSGAKAELASYSYLPYGETQSASGLPMNKGFTGHQWDAELGQYYAPFRYYNPGMGRWLNRDPLGFVDGPNVYGYVGGNPVDYIDQWGLDREICVFLHTWLRVTDPDSGRELDLHWTPVWLPGDDRDTAYLIQSSDQTAYIPIFTINIPSTPDEDRNLINQWRNPPNSTPWYTPIYNCWTCTFVNALPPYHPPSRGPGHPLPYDPKYPNPQSCMR